MNRKTFKLLFRTTKTNIINKQATTLIMESKKKMKQENLDLQLQKLLNELKLDLAPQVTKKAPEVPPVAPQEKENHVSLKKGQKKQEH